MDAEDIRIAKDRIALADQRLQELGRAGIDTAGLASQLSFARAALEQGNTLDVLALCEEVLLSARKLAAPTPPPVAVRSDQSYPSGIYASPATEVLDRHRLTEEIRQAVNADLMPKALTGAQLNERILHTVERTLGEKLAGLRQELAGALDERFQRLAATPETKSFGHPGIDAERLSDDIEARLAQDIEQRLEARGQGIAKQAAETIAAASAGLEAKLAELTDPQRVRGLIDATIGEGLARIELARQESAARRAVGSAEDLGQIERSLAELSQSLPGRVVQILDGCLPGRLQEAMAGITEAVATPLRDLVVETLAKAPPPDLESLAQRLGEELREDLAWQVERLAAERGWVSLADVRAEVGGAGGAPSAPTGATAGFARLEGALVEFVRQTQAQQQQFLSLLQQKVVEKPLPAAAPRAAAEIASDQFMPAPHSETGAIARATDATDLRELGALESNPARAADGDLDVLTQSAQFRAIATLGDPQRQAPPFLPGTQVTRRAAADEQSAAPEVPSATAATTQVDTGAETRVAPGVGRAAPRDLGTEAMELQPLHEPLVRTAATVATQRTDTALVRLTAGQPAADPPSSASAPSTPDIPGLMADSSASRPTIPLPITAGTQGAGTARAQPAGTEPTAAPDHPTQPLTGGLGAQGTGAARATDRVGALEAGLRTLVRNEVERQLNGGLKDKLRSILELDRAVTPQALEAQVRETVAKALGEQGATGLHPTDASSGNRSALAPHGRIGREELIQLLADPGVRQQILAIVAVEALANPGALGELAGVRAFIRSEARKAANEAASAADAKIASGETPTTA